MLRPVAERMLSRGHEVRYLAVTTARAAFTDSSVPLIGFDDLWAYAAPGARRFGEGLAGDLPPNGPVSLEESVAYLGMSFAELVAERGESAAREMYARHGRHAFKPVGLMRRWLEAERPDLVVATNSPRAEQAAILAAGELGIRSVCAVDLFAFQEIEWCGQPGYANRVCVLNEAVRDHFVAFGREPEEIVVTGNPAFDSLRSAAARRRGADLRRSRGWGDDERVILWASQVEPERHPFDAALEGDPSLPRRVEAELRAFVRKNRQCRLVVRYHPSERVTFEPGENIEFSPSSEPLDALLHAVDLVVVTASTVGLEAHLAGKPVVSVDASVFTPDTRYNEIGVSIGVPGPEDLQVILPRLVGDLASAPCAFSSDELGSPTATELVVGVIEAEISVGALA